MRTSSVQGTGPFDALDLFTLVVRWLLGAVFISLGLSKAIEPIEFLKQVRQYEVLHHHMLLNLTASLLPWFEVFCGLLLLLGVAVRGVAILIFAMLGFFTAAVLLRALALRETSGLDFCAIKFDCGCGAGEVLVCRKLGENILLLVLSAAVASWRSHRLCLRSAVFKS